VIDAGSIEASVSLTAFSTACRLRLIGIRSVMTIGVLVSWCLGGFPEVSIVNSERAVTGYRLWRGELVEELVGVGGDEDEVAVFLFEEFLADGVVEEVEEVVEEAAGVEQSDGFAVEAELGPGEDFGEFFEGADAAGEGDKGVGEFGHEGFSFVHGFDDVEFRQLEFVAKVVFEKELGNHAGDVSPVVEDGGGELAHEAEVSAAVDEGDASLGEGLAEESGGGGVGGVCAEG
jgi:hypothetical protein